MTVGQLVSILMRRAYVVVVGLALTLAGAYWSYDAPGVWWGQVDVVFLAPKTDVTPNNILFAEDGVIATAGLVAFQVHDTTTPRLSAADVRLFSLGRSEDLKITEPNSGGQWAVNYDRGVLDVQAVSGSEAGVRTKIEDNVQAIRSRLQEMQDADDVPELLRITTTLAPRDPVVRYVQGSGKRAAISLLLLGVILTVSSTYFLDRALTRLARKKH